MLVKEISDEYGITVWDLIKGRSFFDLPTKLVDLGRVKVLVPEPVVQMGVDKMEEDEIKRLFSQGETKDVDFALEKGIINKVKSAQIPQNALFISININN